MKKLMLLMSIAALSIVGCSDDDKALGPNQTIVGFANAGFSKSYLNDVNDASLTVPVTLISYVNEELPTQDISLTWEVVSSTAADAAVAGVEYDMPAGNGGSVVIPAGQTLATFDLNVHPNVLDPDNPKVLTLLITSATNSIVGKQYEKIQISLKGICVSDIAATYDLAVQVIGTTTGYLLPGEVVTKVAGTESRYSGTSIGPYNSRGLVGASAQIAGVGLIFEDTCGNITLYKDPDWSAPVDTGVAIGQAQGLSNYYNPVYQTAAQAANSSVNEVTGVITIEYNIWFASGVRAYRGVYTPI